jgi:HEAT repeat protein
MEDTTSMLALLVSSHRNERGRAALELGKIADIGTVDALAQALAAEPDFFNRENITWALMRLGDVAVKPLIRLLTHENPVARQSAAHALGKIGHLDARDALIQALNDDNATVVGKVAYALGKIGDPDALAPIIELLTREDRELQGMLVAVVEMFGSTATPVLIGSLTHHNHHVRENTADILRLLGSLDAVPALIEVLQDPHWQVRFAAIHALTTVGGPIAMNAVESMSLDPHHLVRALVRRSECAD